MPTRRSAKIEYMVEVGRYSQYPNIEPVVTVAGPFTDKEMRSGELFDTIERMRDEVEVQLGEQAPDESVFIRVFRR